MHSIVHLIGIGHRDAGLVFQVLGASTEKEPAFPGAISVALFWLTPDSDFRIYRLADGGVFEIGPE